MILDLCPKKFIIKESICIMAMSETFLQGKTCTELRTICGEREITGMSKQPKATLINVILNDLQRTSEIPTLESLSAKSVAELQALCEGRGMAGLNRQPKNILVDILLNDYAREVLSGLAAKLVVIKSESGEITTTIKISCGGSEDDFPLVGRTVGEVQDLLSEALNIPDDPIVMINGSESDDSDYVLESGDELDFVQDADDKG